MRYQYTRYIFQTARALEHWGYEGIVYHAPPWSGDDSAGLLVHRPLSVCDRCVESDYQELYNPLLS